MKTQTQYESAGSELSFSHESGVYSAPFSLLVSSSDENAIVRYTTDGSPPHERSTFYHGGLEINRSMVVNFTTFDTSCNKTFTKVYILNDHTFPIVSISTDPKNLWHPEIGIYVKGENIKNPNFTRRGDDWQKPALMTFFDEKGNLAINMNVEIRISGGATRYNPQKTIRVCAKKEYGQNSIDYDFFGNQNNTKHKCILLRNSGNDWDRTMFRDILAQSLIFETDVDTQFFKPSVVYLNGEYWGIHNIREFYDDQYLKYKYGAKKESVVIIEPDRKKQGYPVIKDGLPGDELKYSELKNNVSDYEYLRKHLDLENYIDYLLINIYTANDDWPDNNIRVWRFKTDTFNNFRLQPLDGKWRWLLFDLDSSFGLFKSSGYSVNTLYKATQPKIKSSVSKREETWATEILFNLLKNEDFKIKFINRYSDLLNTNFSQEKVLETINYLENLYEPEITMHTSRWGGKLDKGGKSAFENTEKWKENVQVLKTFASKRPEYARKHIREVFGLSGTYKIILNPTKTEGGYIKINSIDTKNNITKNELVYFNNVPVRLEALPDTGWKLKSWGNPKLGNNKLVMISTDKDFEISPEFELTWWGKLLNKL